MKDVNLLSFEEVKKAKGFYIYFTNLKTKKTITKEFTSSKEMNKEFYKYVGRKPKYFGGKRVAVIRIDKFPMHKDLEACRVEYYPFSEMHREFNKSLLSLKKKETEYVRKLNNTKTEVDKYKAIIKNYGELIAPVKDKFIKKYTRYYYQLLCDENKLFS